MSESHVQALQDALATQHGILLPGAFNALAARVVAHLGFQALYLTGTGLTNTSLGVPDLGFMDLSQLVEHTMAVRNVVDLPLVVDADTGFGNALNVSHAVRMLERAGASAIQLKDQRAPKRCGHFNGKEVVPIAEMTGKIKAAVDARRNGTLIVARTDARATEGFDAAVERAGRHAEAGADIVFVEAPQSMDETRRIPELVHTPHLINIVAGGRPPTLDREAAAELGFSLLLYADAALREHGSIDEAGGLLATFAERQRLVGEPAFDAMDQCYAFSETRA